jgi:hypothetical protein
LECGALPPLWFFRFRPAKQVGMVQINVTHFRPKSYQFRSLDLPDFHSPPPGKSAAESAKSAISTMVDTFGTLGARARSQTQALFASRAVSDPKRHPNWSKCCEICEICEIDDYLTVRCHPLPPVSLPTAD